MNRHDSGPRRSRSVDSYLWRTRVLAVVALLALVAGVLSDVMRPRFWARHALVTGLVSSLIVVMLSAAILNEVLERRRRQRWSVLAQYVMLELVRNARMIWIGVLEHAGLLPHGAARPEDVETNGLLVRDTARLTTALYGVVSDPTRLRLLNEEIAVLTAHCDEVLGRWATVMLSVDLYAELIDRHVELASDLAWLTALLDNAEPPADALRHRRSRSNPAVQIEGGISADTIADRLVVITQLAEELDRGTLALALRIVPLTWWKDRLASRS